MSIDINRVLERNIATKARTIIVVIGTRFSVLACYIPNFLVYSSHSAFLIY